MITWRKTSPLMKALLISCFIHGLFAVAMLGQSDPTTVSPETTELYEMDLTQPTPSQAEVSTNNATDLTSVPDATSEPEKNPLGEPEKSAVSTPLPLPTPPLIQPNQSKPNIPAVTKRNIRIPTVLKTVAPLYPEKAAREKQAFKITLMVEISESGQPSVVTVIQSSGTKELDDAAVAAIKQWVFSPAIDLTTGKPILFPTTIDQNYPFAKKNLPSQQQGVTP